MMTLSHDLPAAALDGLAQLKKHLESTVQVAELKGKHSSEPKQYESTSEERYLKVSPYGDQPHLLDMTTVSPPCQLLARALTEMQVIREDYATAVYQQAFSWPKVHEKLQELVAAETDGVWEEQSFYIVVFRSRLSPETDRTHLGDLDKRSHGEAMAGGGLLKYWFGKPDANGRNMATCVWRRQEDAKCGGNGPSHRQAARETRALYLEWHIERLRLTIGDGASTWSISEW